MGVLSMLKVYCITMITCMKVSVRHWHTRTHLTAIPINFVPLTCQVRLHQPLQIVYFHTYVYCGQQHSYLSALGYKNRHIHHQIMDLHAVFIIK